MKRWLSLVKRHLTPGTWTKPAKKRRPVTYAPPEVHPSRMPTIVRDSYVHVATDTTLPLVPRRLRPITLCDPDLIAYRNERPASVARPSSQVLPAHELIERDIYRRYAFIDFEPALTVTVSELMPYHLNLRKPRPARFSDRVVSFFRGADHGELRSSVSLHDCE